MKPWRMFIRPAVVLCFLGGLSVGCGSSSDGTCPGVAGKFQALYQPRSGTCGAIPADQTNSVQVQNNITIEKFANIDVETETIVKGCTVWMAQKVTDKTGNVQQQIQGATLEVQDENQLSGMVTLTRYDVQTGQPICSGEYDAVLYKAAMSIGGAAM